MVVVFEIELLVQYSVSRSLLERWAYPLVDQKVVKNTAESLNKAQGRTKKNEAGNLGGMMSK